MQPTTRPLTDSVSASVPATPDLTVGRYYVGDRGQVCRLIAVEARVWSGGVYDVAITVSGHWGELATSERRADVWASSHRRATDEEISAALASWALKAADASRSIDTSREGT
jgi:hypothetical protein